MQKLLWQDRWRQGLDFIDPRVAQLRWLAIKHRFNQRLPKYGGTADTLFERFFRGDAAYGGKVDGIGLGLSLCREISIASNAELEFSVIN